MRAPPPDPRKGVGRRGIQGLPRREFYSGGIHYAAPWGKPGTLCKTAGHIKVQGRVKGQVNCPECMEVVEWVWSHRKGSKRTS